MERREKRRELANAFVWDALPPAMRLSTWKLREMAIDVGRMLHPSRLTSKEAAAAMRRLGEAGLVGCHVCGARFHEPCDSGLHS